MPVMFAVKVDALAIILFLLHHAKAFIYPLRPEMAHSFHINSGQQTCCRLLQPFYGGRLNLPRRAFCVVGESASVKASITGSGIGAGTKLSEKDSRSQKGHFYGDGDPNHKPSILQNITEQRYSDVEEAKKSVSEDYLKEQIEVFDQANGRPLNLSQRIILEEPDMALAAEFKRASPSKGDIAVDLEAGEQGSLYASVGAAVLSVLTEPNWFKGSLDDMKEVRLATQGFREGKTKLRPAILRKDFIVDEYQLLEARAYGADTVLLIVAILEIGRLSGLITASRKLGMEPLVEVHTDEEMSIALEAGARVIGVNNRNLHTFELDLDTTERVSRVALKHDVPWQAGMDGQGKDRIVLSALSGITGPNDVKRFGKIGVSLVLVGEALMRAADPAKEIRELLGREEPTTASSRRLVKICGVTTKEDALVAVTAGANVIGVIFAEGSPRRVTVERAGEITRTVQAFGERNTRKAMEPPKEAVSSSAWFQDWARVLAEASHRTPLVVGVFQNQLLEEVRRIAAEANLDLVQLHGNEAMEACGQCGVPALCVVHVPASEGGSESEQASSEQRAKDVLARLKPGFAAGVLLDTTIKGTLGGTGVTFDHEVARLVGEAGVPVIVAGGLTADNVAACVTDTSSFGVDVSSGVEKSKGLKDITLVQRFLQEARRAQHDLSKHED